MRAAFYHGARLFEACLETPGFADRGDSPEHQGVRQLRSTANPESPNFRRPLSARCQVVARDPAAYTAYELGTAIQNTLHAVEARLMALASTMGPVSFCEDEARRAAVSAPFSAGSGVVVSIGSAGGGWVPAVGQLVLFRNPGSDAGFVAAITAVGSGTITCTLTAAITTAWQVVRVDRVFNSCYYKTMDRQPLAGPDDPDVHVPEVSYRFECHGAVSVPTASLLSMDT